MDQPEVLSKSCPDCAAQMPESASFCPGCGRSMRGSEPTKERLHGLPENIAGALAYLTVIPALVFLFVDPYRKNSFVRFHSLQCVLFWASAVVLAACLRLASVVLLIIPVVGPLLAFLFAVLASLAAALVWLVLLVKAFQGDRFKLPLLGDFAERHSGP